MSAKIRGHRSGFNPTGSNDCVPYFDEIKTKFGGRPAVPKGPLDVPKGLADIETSNRRMAKAVVGEGGRHHTSFDGTNAFSRGRKRR
jgi:hypothetical protein